MSKTTGVDLIAAERSRQVHQCGWSEDHDIDEHADGTLSRQAASLILLHYMKSVDSRKVVEYGDSFELATKSKFQNAGGLVRSLTVAGALIAAEIDRVLAEHDSLHGS